MLVPPSLTMGQAGKRSANTADGGSTRAVRRQQEGPRGRSMPLHQRAQRVGTGAGGLCSSKCLSAERRDTVPTVSTSATPSLTGCAYQHAVKGRHCVDS